MIARRNARFDDTPRDARRQAIAETNAFLTWALARERGLPRIPRRKVDAGGFSELLKLPMARTVVDHVWGRLLGAVREPDEPLNRGSRGAK
jgi:hypothetical protein